MKILVTSMKDVKRTYNDRILQFLKYLSQDHFITVLSTNAWWWQANTQEFNPVEEDYAVQYFGEMYQRVKVLYLTERKSNPLIQEISVRAFNNLLKQIDYQSFNVHINYHSLIPGYFIAWKLKGAGIPTIFDIADDLPYGFRTSRQVPNGVRPLVGVMASLMVKGNARIARKITYTYSSLSNLSYCSPAKSQLIPNGVDTELFSPRPSAELRRNLGIYDDFVIGYVGVLEGWVDLQPLFITLKQLEADFPNIKALIVGEGSKFQMYQGVVNKFDISDRVVFTGAVPYAEVPRYIACMDVALIPFIVNPWTANALPLKLFEYMACEKPVISTELATVREVAGDKVLHYSDWQELKQKVMQLRFNQSLREELGSRGRKLVEQNYKWSEICRKFEEVLLEVATRERNKS